MTFFRWLFRRHAVDRDLNAEIRQHFEMAIADRIAGGEDPESARLAAINEFGNVLQVKEEAREVWRGRAIPAVLDLWQDIRFGVRMLIKNPAFSLVVITVLALGIAGNAAVFSLFKAMALNPLPGVDSSSRLAVVIGETTEGRRFGLSLPDYRDFKIRNESFASVTASAMVFASIGRGTEAERIIAELVTGDYFQTLGVAVQQGRTLLPSDDLAAGQHPVAVISDALWRRAFGADPATVGRTLYLNGQPLTIVGIADREFNGTVVSMGVDVFAPVMMQPQLNAPSRLDARGVFMMMVLGRLKPGVTMAAAGAEAGVFASQLTAAHPLPNYQRRFAVLPIWQSPFGAQTYWLPAVAVLGGMGVLILLVVCANVANLVLVRGVSRRGEIGVRLALGASRGRLIRLLFVENLVLAMPGALAGAALAAIALPFLATGAISAAPARIALDTSVDGTVLAFALVVASLCAVVFGFVPALRASRLELTAVLNDLSPRMASRGRLRSLLVISQIAVSLILLVVAGLVLRSYAAAQRAELGFDAARVTSIALDLQTAGYGGDRGPQIVTRLLDAFDNEPAFESASLAMNVPMSLVDNASRAVEIEGYAPRSDEDMVFLYNIVSPNYFSALHIPLLAGREFARTDDEDGAPAVIINDTLARRMWTTPANAVGRRIRSGAEWRTVIGVVGDVKYSRLSDGPRPFVYFPLLQNYVPGLTVHARSRGDVTYAMTRVRDHIQTIDASIPIVRSMTLTDQARAALSIYELAAGALSLFGTVTILLAAIGIYGLVAYTVRQSTQEIGIRMAVGASRLDVVRGFLGRGVALAAIGASIGLAGAFAAGSAVGSLLYGVGARDPVAFTGGTAVVMIVALLASAVPAWKASRVDPLSALRHH